MNQPVKDVAKLAAAEMPVQGMPLTGLARGGSFFLDEALRGLIDRAVLYARAGICVHLRGPAGSGKTALALHVAEELGRPVTLMVGNDGLTSTDFIGREIGQSSISVVDRYVQTVRRTETMTRAEWKDSMLAVAMERGHTLVYDEFTRASPEANSTLLSVLEEGVLMVTDQASDRSVIRAHPCFRVLLTSNPHDYVGVKSAPDALMDRVLTLAIDRPSIETLAGIVAQRSGLDPETAGRIVHIVRAAQDATGAEALGSIRTAIIIARVAAFARREAPLPEAALAAIAADVFAGRGAAMSPADVARLLAQISSGVPA